MLYNEIEKYLESERPWRDARYNGDFGQRQQILKLVAAKRLSTKAKDNHGNEYTVYLYMENLPTGWISVGEKTTDDQFRNAFTLKWVLCIKDTPGQWFMQDLLKRTSHIISIDFGQHWDCVNFDEVMKEARGLI